jgi:hypothetical protein
MPAMPLLFSYGTLQQQSVQQSTFGRLLTGRSDALVGYSQSLLRIEDAAVLAASGLSHHPIVRFSGDARDRIEGTVFEVSDAELARPTPTKSPTTSGCWPPWHRGPRPGCTWGCELKGFLSS